jgi:hypothetical protein
MEDCKHRQYSLALLSGLGRRVDSNSANHFLDRKREGGNKNPTGIQGKQAKSYQVLGVGGNHNTLRHEN